MKEKLLRDVENIINTLACNDKQPIEVRGAFNAAINLRSMIEQIDTNDMAKEEIPVVKEEIKRVKDIPQEPTRYRLPDAPSKEEDNKTKE